MRANGRPVREHGLDPTMTTNHPLGSTVCCEPAGSVARSPGNGPDSPCARSLPEFDKLCETLLEWSDEIFAFHDTNRITNGRIEGTNNKLGVLKRVAYGFVNVHNFAARALLITPGMPTSP